MNERGSARFAWDLELVERVQAFHFKGRQGAKTGTGGHLRGDKGQGTRDKGQGKLAQVRGLEPGQSAISPATFPNLKTPADFRKVTDGVRERSGGIPIGFKLSANRIEDDIDFALEASADIIMLDGRGGGLRVAEDFVKAMALAADAITVSNSTVQAAGCIAARMCSSNNCPVGVARQKPKLRARLNVQVGAEKLARYFGAIVDFMQVLSRACGHDDLTKLSTDDISTWKQEMADLSGIQFAGVVH